MSTIVLGLSALSFCAWAVSLGGLAAMQDSCGTGNFKPQFHSVELPCYRLFRFEWFIICFEFVVVVGILASIFAKRYAKYRQTWLALTAMVTLLYIFLADRWYTFSNAELTGDIKDRVRTMAAGTIMVSAVNCLLVMFLGLEEESEEKKPVEGKANAV